MKKDTQQRFICILAGMCIVLMIGLIVTGQRAENAQDKLRAGYENSLYNTLDGISSVYNDLCKASFCQDRDYLRTLYTQISARAGTASARVGELPISQESVQKTEELLNHVSDYCGFLAEQGTAQEGEGDNIRALRDSCGRLYAALGDISAVVGSGQDVFAADVLADTDIAWQQAEADSVNYPTLIYDGPFSQSEKIGKPRVERAEVSKEDARKKATELLGECSDEGENQGDLPCYVFCANDKNAAYTKAGGLLLWYLDSGRQDGERTGDGERIVGGERTGDGERIGDGERTGDGERIGDGEKIGDGERIGDGDAHQAAVEFLEKAGYEGFESVFASKGQDNIIFNFTPVLQDAVVYPDLVKVRVSLVSGRVTGFEGSGYVISNYEREMQTPTVTAEQAQSSVSGMLTVKSKRLSIIPNGNSEATAWEFYCVYGQDKYIIYIDALSGKQLQMYRIIPTENGEMVI